jgi:hypothetical protein
MPHRIPRLLLACLLCCVALPSIAFADNDRTQVGNNINIGPGEEVGEATCFGCSVHVRGRVAGDVTTFGGSIVIEGDGQVGGDVTAFAGGIRLDHDVKVDGDVTVFGGRIHRDPLSSIGGDVTTMSGAGWIFLIFVMPLIVFGLFVWLVVWVIRRLLRPRVIVAA